MTNLEHFYKREINSTLNIDLRPTFIDHVFVADYLTFNLNTQEASIAYRALNTFYLYNTFMSLYCKADASNYTEYKEVYVESDILRVYQTHTLHTPTYDIDDDKVSKLQWSSSSLIAATFMRAVNSLLTTKFTETKKAHIYKDKKTQLVIDAEQMLIMIDSEQYDFTIDAHYMYVYHANKHYKKFLQYKNITAYKIAGSILVLSKAHA